MIVVVVVIMMMMMMIIIIITIVIALNGKNRFFYSLPTAPWTPLTTSFRKCHVLKPEMSSPNRDSNQQNSSIGGRLRNHYTTASSPPPTPSNFLHVVKRDIALCLVCMVVLWVAGQYWRQQWPHFCSWRGAIVDRQSRWKRILLLLLRSQLYLWGSPLWVRFERIWRFLNPTFEVVTFRLCGRCMLGVFLLLAFTCLGHECQDLLGPRDEMHVYTDYISVYTLIRKRVWEMESEPMLTPREKSPLPEKFSPEEDRTQDTA